MLFYLQQLSGISYPSNLAPNTPHTTQKAALSQNSVFCNRDSFATSAGGRSGLKLVRADAINGHIILVLLASEDKEDREPVVDIRTHTSIDSRASLDSRASM